MTNIEILCFVMGWQGGTLAQVSLALCIPPETIQNAGHDEMLDLCRRAQVYHRFHISKGTS